MTPYKSAKFNKEDGQIEGWTDTRGKRKTDLDRSGLVGTGNFYLLLCG